MDHVYLTGPQGSMVDIGSWIRADPGPDFGGRDIIQQQYAQNALSEGGRFAYEIEPVRRMMFPLSVPSGGVGALSLDAIESLLRFCARPGGYIDIQPEGTPTAEMVRFDLLGGRVNHDPYSLPIQRLRRRQLSLQLDTQPFGYWPTWIALASSGRASIPGQITLTPPASRIGDAPGLVDFRLNFTIGGGTSYDGGSWLNDFIAISLDAPPSAITFWGGPSFYPSHVHGLASLAGDVFAPGSQFFVYVPLATTGWQRSGEVLITETLDPFQRGRYRAFAYVRAQASQLPVQVVLDTVPLIQSPLVPMASVQPVATLIAGAGSWVDGPSQAFSILDLGEISLPPVASGWAAGAGAALRIWSKLASPMPASPIIGLGGLYLMPLGNAGILPRGFNYPTMMPVIQTDDMVLRVHAGINNVFLTNGPIDTDNAVVSDLRRYWQGGMLRLGASNTKIDLIHGARKFNATGATSTIARQADGFPFTHVQAFYRPRFNFLKGL